MQSCSTYRRKYAAIEITLPIVCGLAYVQYYSENLIEIDDAVRENIKRFLVEQHKNGIVLPCYRQFADYLPFMMQYSDKTIIGYHANRRELCKDTLCPRTG